MKRQLLFIICCLLFVSGSAQVQVDVKLDSLQLFIGQQMDLTLSVTIDAKQKLVMPDIKKGQELIPDIEVVNVGKPDSAVLNNGKRLTVSQAYTITAWDSAFYYLPPMEVMVDGKKYDSKSLALKVYTIDVDTLHVDRFFPPHGIMELHFLWREWLPVMFAGLLFVYMAVCMGILIYYVKNGKPIFRFVRRKKKLPPHKVAMDEIERIKSERKWTEEDSKEYYTLLTDTLRNYIRDRYGFNAMEMTSNEIIERLIAENNEEALDELREIGAVYHAVDVDVPEPFRHEIHRLLRRDVGQIADHHLGGGIFTDRDFADHEGLAFQPAAKEGGVDRHVLGESLTGTFDHAAGGRFFHRSAFPLFDREQRDLLFSLRKQRGRTRRDLLFRLF